ncbi:MAG: hypothetical protein ACI9YE_000771, partial [Psychroserpens sp.]
SKIGIQSVADINLIQDNWADLVISNHVLEHVHCPLDELKKIYKSKTGWENSGCSSL